MSLSGGLLLAKGLNPTVIAKLTEGFNLFPLAVRESL